LSDQLVGGGLSLGIRFLDTGLAGATQRDHSDRGLLYDAVTFNVEFDRVPWFTSRMLDRAGQQTCSHTQMFVNMSTIAQRRYETQ